jgi:hypothetical protein
MDVILLSAIILGAFIAYELYSGEVPMRWFGSIKRSTRPFFYWLFICFYLAVFGIVVYAWVDGLRIPFSGLFN